jgi:ribosomal protein S18 acetylase RimI-like enzyme
MQTSDTIVSSLDRVQRTLAVDVAYTISRMKVLERLPGNPLGIDYRWVDETAVALMSRLKPFARVVGLRAGQERHIEPLVSWYRERGTAAATLYLKDGVGYLADATTDPAFRNRGLQSALLRRRIRDAGAAGADTVFSGASPFSASHRNMERAGMRVHFVRSLWTPV